MPCRAVLCCALQACSCLLMTSAVGVASVTMYCSSCGISTPHSPCCTSHCSSNSSSKRLKAAALGRVSVLHRYGECYGHIPSTLCA
jgi:hypothetical protein